MEKIINLEPDFFSVTDDLESRIVKEKLKGGPKATRIVIKNADTGEELGEYHNKIVLTGSIFGAINAFGISPSVILPDYNRDMVLDNTLDYTNITPKNSPIVCLFCMGDDGCGTASKDVFKVNYTDRIDPIKGVYPFRYVDKDKDLNDDLRKYYFGRKTLEDEGKIAYYFKNFDTTPQMHLRYTDGTQITDEIYNIETTQAAECYIETKLKVSRNDFRDYFEQVLGWDNARVSSLSLCYAWYDDTIDNYRWYQQIYPYSKLNFSCMDLVDLTLSLEFLYQVFY